MVSGLFQMRKPESKAFVQGLGLGLEAHRLAARMNYPDNVSVYLPWVERQWGLDFTCLFRPWHSPMPPCPSRQPCCFYALVTQIMSRWTFTARKLPRRAPQPRLEGWRTPGFFPLTPGFRSLPVNLRETVLPWFVWLALTVLKTAIRRPFWKFVTD